MNSKSYDFMCNDGLNENNSLLHLIDTFNSDIDEEVSMFEHSRYYNDTEFIHMLRDQQSKLCILNLNCQSLNSKFDELSLYIYNLLQRSAYRYYHTSRNLVRHV